MLAMWNDPKVYQYTTKAPSTPQRNWSRYLTYQGLWSVLGYGYWVVEDKASKKYLGEVGFADFKRDMVPPIQNIPEMGWVLTSESHGQGIATEATAGAFQWMRNSFQGQDSFCIIDPANAASLKVAAKLGYSFSEVASFLGDEVSVYRTRF